MSVTIEADTAQMLSHLRIAVMRLARRVRTQGLDESGCTVSQLAVLRTVAAYGSISPRELAAHERVQPPSMTRVLAHLENMGLIARAPHPTDGRQTIITATETGRDLAEADRRRLDAWLSQGVAGLEQDELDVLARAVPVLERLAQQA